ncbi:glutathione S-transferase family protein [Neotabrizicola sp. sgz301269]|uniref:glutathione S-transferase family protein n=1 Tax=Neotabrizicola sp. sgz301269 TaxID=3276282 RepID=UPI0037706E05
MPNWATSSPIAPLTGRGFGATDTAEFLATSPFGKVPVLRYLAGRQPNALWPADPAWRCLADRWMEWASISLTPPLTRPRKAEAEADLAAVIKAVEALDAWLARQPYLAGETLPLADIVAAPSVHHWFRLPESSLPLPALARCRDRLETNEGYCRHIRTPL